MSETQTFAYRMATNWIPAGMLVMSLFVVGLFSEESLRNSEMLASIYSLVSQLVPGAHAFPAASGFPTCSAVVISLNWLFVPLLVALFVYARRPTNEVLAKRVDQLGQKRGMFVRRILFPFCWFMFVAMDLGVIPGFGYFSGHGAHFAMEYSILKTIDQHPLGIAVFYWMLCVGESFVYGFTFFYVWRFGLLAKRRAWKALSPT